jgi:hypothetical protein
VKESLLTVLSTFGVVLLTSGALADPASAPFGLSWGMRQSDVSNMGVVFSEREDSKYGAQRSARIFLKFSTILKQFFYSSVLTISFGGLQQSPKNLHTTNGEHRRDLDSLN